MPGDAVLLAVGVMIPSLMQLLVRRFAEPATPLARLYALAAVPIASYCDDARRSCARRGAEPHGRCRASRGEGSTRSKRIGCSRSWDVVSCGDVLAAGAVGVEGAAAGETLHRLSPLVVWCGVPALLVGLLFWRRMTRAAIVGLADGGLGVGVLGGAGA